MPNLMRLFRNEDVYVCSLLVKKNAHCTCACRPRYTAYDIFVSVLLRDRPEPRVEPGRVDLHLVGLLLGLGLALPGQVGQQPGLARAPCRPRLRRAGPRPPIGAGAVQNCRSILWN